MITVFHFNRDYAQLLWTPERLRAIVDEPILAHVVEAWEVGFYHKVATVACIDLAKAFELTKNIAQPWVLNGGVRAESEVDYRNTSIGDILEANGALHVITSYGFTKLP